MRIILDLQALQNDSRHRGIGRHTRDFAAALVRASRRHEIILLYNARLPEIADEVLRDLVHEGTDVTTLKFASLQGTRFQNPDNKGRALLAQIVYEKCLADLRPDVVLTGSTIEGFQDDTVVHGGQFTRNYALGSIFYDLIPLSDPDLYLPGQAVRDWFDDRLAALRRNDFLLTNSNTSRDEAIRLLGFPADHTHSPGSAVDTRIFSAGARPDPAMLFARFGITRDYVMHTGAFEPRKNFEGLLREFSRLPQAIRSVTQLVFVCAPPEPALARLHRLAKQSGLAPDQLIVTGHVSDDELVALYSGAKVFAFPSLREGFGLPPLEAMSCGTATIASNNSSLPEVIGWNEALFDPLIDGDLARLLKRALEDDTFGRRLRDHAKERSALFNWPDTAKRALASLEAEAARAQSSLSAAGRPSVDAVLDRVADVHASGGLASDDIRDAVDALAENEHNAMLYLAPAKRGAAQSWRIEGPFDSSYSLALVNRQLARGLERLGHGVALVSTDGNGDFIPDADFLDANPDLDRMADERWRPRQGETAIHSRNIYPPRTSDMAGDLRTLHCYAWEETAFPYHSVVEFNAGLDLIFATSRHVEKVLIDNGVSVPIRVCGLGTDHLDAIEADPDFRLDARPFRFLHVSSGLARKGIDVLFDAFAETFTSSDPVSLVIKTAPGQANAIADLLSERRARRTDFPDVVVLWDDLSPAELKALHQQCQIAVYPTRAEGFGLPIAEAIACGLPVITTAWSGHMDFCSAADMWLVDFELEPSRSHLHLAGSAWAKPDIGMLRDCLRDAFVSSHEQRVDMARRARERMIRDQNWRIVAARHVAHARDHAAARPASALPRIGWISTWGETCGIATYSYHLLSHFNTPVTILARDGSDMRGCGAHRVEPMWSAPMHGGLSRIVEIADRRSFDVIVIQFSFAFFDLDELARLVAQASRAGVVVIVEMHATALPAAEGGHAVLREMKDSLAKCGRVLVHSVADLNRLAEIGLVDNVTLMPHGLSVRMPESAPARVAAEPPLVVSFGFALPHKGLVELVESMALLRDAGMPVRLRLLNAEFPASASKATIARIREKIALHALADQVECDFTFNTEDAIHRALAAADLIVFPYQDTDESASGAVRHALASGRPTAVTPIPIFSELEGIVHVLDGGKPAALASGIARILADIATNDAASRAIGERAALFRSQLGFDRAAVRLEGMCTALSRSARALTRWYPASSPQFRGGAARGMGQSVGISVGDSLIGPGVRLPPARYAITVEGAFSGGCATPPSIAILPRRETVSSLEHAAGGDQRFTWLATIEITRDDEPLKLMMSPGGNDAIRIDRISIQSIR